jgi:hypothetical protein
VFINPPLTLESDAEAVLDRPPLTLELNPEAVFWNPPLTLEPPPGLLGGPAATL